MEVSTMDDVLGTDRDPRWAVVTAETPVVFDGEVTTWGKLDRHSRKFVTMKRDGVLTGGFPF